MYCDLNWYLFLYNVAKQLFPNQGSSGGNPIQPVDFIDMVDLDAMTSDAVQMGRQISNAGAVDSADRDVPAIGPTVRDFLNAFVISLDQLPPDVQSVFGRTGAVGTTPGAAGQMLLSTGPAANPAFGNNPVITGGTIDGAVIGGSSPAQITGTTVTGTFFRTLVATVASVSTGTATTIYTLPNASPAAYLAHANFNFTSNDTTNYSAFAVILSDGSAARIALSNNAVSMSISLSGLNIQVTQSSGASQPVNLILTRIG